MVMYPTSYQQSNIRLNLPLEKEERTYLYLNSMGVHEQQSSNHEFGRKIEKTDQVIVLVIPFPAQSHLNQLLELSCLISSYNIPVHYACSAIHIHQVKLRFSDKNLLHKANIHFHELPTPPFLSPPPNPNATTKFPAHLQPSWSAALHLREPIAQLLKEHSPKVRRVVVIHDILMSYMVQDAATIPNAVSYTFLPVSAFRFLFSGREDNAGAPKGLPSRTEIHTQDFLEFVALQRDYFKQRSGIILNSSRAIEGSYIDMLAKENHDISDKIWAIGPLHHGKSSSDIQHPCLEWLSKQAPKSVIYVSFGTTTSLTNEQIKEIAEGLEQSQQKFIWVLRDADKGDISLDDSLNNARLQEGFEDRVRENGMVIRDWAPQLEILAHPSIGGFMSHCGWNSCLEAITMGVPIAAWPMHSDQPMNAFLVSEILKVGIQVNEWEHREELVTSSTISKAVRRLVATNEGEELRKRADKLGGDVRKGVEEGGASSVELNSFIAHITS